MRLTAFLLVLSTVGCGRKAASETVLIGHIAPFSGPMKAVGEREMQALRLDPWSDGERQVSFVHVDSQGKLDVLGPQAVRLITVNKVIAILGGRTADEADKLARAAEPYDVPVLTWAQLSRVPAAGNLFSVNIALPEEARTLARFVAEELKAKEVTILIDDRDASQAALAGLVGKEFSRTAVAATATLHYKNEKGLLDGVPRFDKAHRAPILFAGATEDLEKFESKLRAAGCQAPIVLAGILGAFPSQTKNPKGIYFLALFDPDAPDAGKAFVEKYEKEFRERPDADAALASDAAQVVLAAVGKLKVAAPGPLRDELGKSDVEFSCTAGAFAFAPDHTARRPVFVIRRKYGKSTLAKRYDAK
jgi:ABC-type branched-subunit amino acid transport system substrate-binding protein